MQPTTDLPPDKAAGFPKSGELFIQEGLVRPEDVERALEIQKNSRQAMVGSRQRLLGMILCSLNLITPVDCYTVLRRGGRLVTLDEFLTSSESIPKNKLKTAITLAREQQTPLLEPLLVSKTVSLPELQALTFGLFHIPFRFIRNFQFTAETRDLTAVIPKADARKYGMIPLVIRESTLLIGLADPEALLGAAVVNASAVHLRLKFVFIPWSDFLSSYETLYHEKHPCGTEKTVPRNTLPGPGGPPDLSLLFSFKAGISDPELETEAVRKLYNRYEVLRKLTGSPARPDCFERFREFIIHEHRSISDQIVCSSIDYMLRQEKSGVGIIATPQRK